MKVFIAGVLLCFAVCANTQVRSNGGSKSMPNQRFGWIGEENNRPAFFDLSRYEPDVYFLVYRYSQYVDGHYNAVVDWIDPIKQKGTWGQKRVYKLTVDLKLAETDIKHTCNSTYVTDYPLTFKSGQFTYSNCQPPISGLRS